MSPAVMTEELRECVIEDFVYILHLIDARSSEKVIKIWLFVISVTRIDQPQDYSGGFALCLENFSFKKFLTLLGSQ